mmetsp:Transcript_34271/g.102728  ORF Transcript_34271/g.102728 Transcript_34271/m.102728 type:complete len:219 (-) Transcript_34271:113-769(-)
MYNSPVLRRVRRQSHGEQPRIQNDLPRQEHRAAETPPGDRRQVRLHRRRDDVAGREDADAVVPRVPRIACYFEEAGAGGGVEDGGGDAGGIIDRVVGRACVVVGAFLFAFALLVALLVVVIIPVPIPQAHQTPAFPLRHVHRLAELRQPPSSSSSAALALAVAVVVVGGGDRHRIPYHSPFQSAGIRVDSGASDSGIAGRRAGEYMRGSLDDRGAISG